MPHPAPSLLRIEGEMTIYRAEELKQTLLAAVAGAQALDLDLAAVTEFDGAGLQLLMLARRTASRAGCPLRLLAVSPALAEVFALLQLGPHGEGLIHES